MIAADFEHASKLLPGTYSNSDLVDLGFVLLECMEGHLLPADRRNHRIVVEQRRANKVFGLASAEKWSGSKQLVDFLDNIFDEDRPIHSKFDRPVSLPSSKLSVIHNLITRISIDMCHQGEKVMIVLGAT
jgi:hypothetical protein